MAANGEQLLGNALTAARKLDEPGIAAMLLAPLQIEMLARTDAERLPSSRRATESRGLTTWSRSGLAATGQRTSWNPQRADWLESLPAVCEALRAAPNAGRSTGRLLSACAWARLRESAGRLLRLTSPSYRYKALGETRTVRRHLAGEHGNHRCAAIARDDPTRCY